MSPKEYTTVDKPGDRRRSQPDDLEGRTPRARPKRIELGTLLAELADPAWHVTASHVTALAGIGRPEVDRLATIWQLVPAERRIEVLQMVTEIAEDNVDLDFSAFVEYCLGDADERVRTLAAGAVEYDQGWPAGSRLLEMLRSDPSPAVRAAAAGSLGEYVLEGFTGSHRPRWLQGLVDTMLTVAADRGSDLGLRTQCLVSVAAVDDERVEPLIREFYAMEESAAQYSAVRAMGRACNPVWTKQIAAELASRDVEMRFHAAGAAGDLASPEVLPALARLIGDPDAEVREVAIAALGEIGGPVAIRILTELVASAPAERRESIEDALATARENEDPLGIQDLRPKSGQGFTTPHNN